MDELKTKWRLFISDERRGAQKFRGAFFVSLFSAFTFFVNGPIESYVQNVLFLKYSFSDLLLCMLPLAAAAVLLLSIGALLLRGKFYDLALSALFGGTLCGYLQGNFLNSNIGSMDGAKINWSEQTAHTMKNLLLWILFFSLIFVVYYFSKKLWRDILCYGALFFVAIQAVGLFSVLVTRFPAEKMQNYYLSEENMFELSSKENVIVFVLDSFDSSYAVEILEETPEFYRELQDFTLYPDSAGRHYRTFPSITYLLTGESFYHDVPVEEFLEQVWGKENLLASLKERDYDIRLLTDSNHFGSGAIGLLDNMVYQKRAVSYPGIVRGMFQIMAYRCMPNALKPSFWFYTDDINQLLVTGAEEDAAAAYSWDDGRFYEKLKEQQLSVSDQAGSFRMYHLQGSHEPFVLGEDGMRTQKSGYLQQTKGALSIVKNYLGQLKELGLYEDAVIIITADHGKAKEKTELDYATSPAFFIKASGSRGEELAVSMAPIAQADFIPTILDCLDMEHQSFGRSVFEIGEQEERKRSYLYTTFFKNYGEDKIVEYEIDGDARDFKNWTKTGLIQKSRYSIYSIYEE